MADSDSIFGGSGAIEGVFGISSGSTVTFSNNNSDTQVGYGFLIDQYQIQWGRSVVSKRMLNMAGRIAIVGAGQGTLTLQGLIGKAEDFKTLVNATSGGEACGNMTCVINAGSGFGLCENGTTSTVGGSAAITCSGLILTNIGTTGQISDNNVLTMGATLQFQISGLTIDSAATGGVAV